MTKSTHDCKQILRDKLHDIINDKSKQVQDAVRPIYLQNSPDQFELLGSSVLIRIASQSFLITAAHVMDIAKEKPLFITGTDSLINPEAQFYSTRKPLSGDRKDDKLDLAVVPLDEDIVNKLEHSCLFLGLDGIDTAERSEPHSYYITIGYPGTKQPKQKGNQLDYIPMTLGTIEVSVGKYQHYGINPNTNLLLRFNKKKVHSKLRLETAPNPHGMSGGGVWRVDSPSDCARLVAIQHEYLDREHLILATKIGLCFDVIGYHFPNLRQYLPRPEGR